MNAGATPLALARRARVLADFFGEFAPRLLGDLREAGVLHGAAARVIAREWDAVALHACVRGAVASHDPDRAMADLVDAFHDHVLADDPATGAHETPAARRAHLAARYAEYDGITRTLGVTGAASVPGAIAASCAAHVGATDAFALAETLAPLLEALAEGAAAALAAPLGAELALPTFAGLAALTRRLDAERITWAVGGSGLLAALGLVGHVNDWDVQVEAAPERLREMFADVPHSFHEHGGCHADWKLDFTESHTELITRFAFFVPAGIVRVPLHVSRRWRGLNMAGPEGWACAYWLMGEHDEPGLRARRAARAEVLLGWLRRHGADRARLAELRAQPLPEALATKLAALPLR